MCWSVEASVAVAVFGTVATAAARARGQPFAIWGTLAYFTFMELLQVAGYRVADDCGTASNSRVTLLSYLHIVFQPILINAFAMELVPEAVKLRVRKWVLGLAAGSACVMLAQLIQWPALGNCAAGSPLCAEHLCTVSGNWHIAWNIPYNALMVPLDQTLGVQSGFPTYMAAVFLLPLAYGAWRFVLLHALTGPVLAWALTSDPNEMPAVWCLFSVVILCIGLSTRLRGPMTAKRWWGVAV